MNYAEKILETISKVTAIAISHGYDSDVFDSDKFGIEALAIQGLLTKDSMQFFTNIISAFRNEMNDLEEQGTCVNHMDWLVALLELYTEVCK